MTTSKLSKGGTRPPIDGKPVRATKRIYLLLYKPKDYNTTYKDPQVTGSRY
jgi:hypothetical protein